MMRRLACCWLVGVFLPMTFAVGTRLGSKKNPNDDIGEETAAASVFGNGKAKGLPDMPPWRPKAKSITVYNDGNANNKPVFWTSNKVALAPDSTMLATGYDLEERVGNLIRPAAYQVQTFVFVPLLREWIIADDVLEVKFPDCGLQGFAIADMTMTNQMLGINYVALHTDRMDDDDDDDNDDVTFSGMVQAWAWTSCMDSNTRRMCWREMQPPLQNNSPNKESEGFGTSMAIANSGDGDAAIVAVGIPAETTHGRVEVYRYSSNDDIFWENGIWEPVGTPIQGSHYAFGNNVALSQDGTILGVLAFTNDSIKNNDDDDGDFDDPCSIEVYQMDDEDKEWKLMGQKLIMRPADRSNGSTNNDEDDDLVNCSTMEMSGDGLTIAIGSRVSDPGCPGVPEPRGHVRVLSYDKKTKTWKQKGKDLDTLVSLIRPEEYYEIGMSLSLSGNGERIAVSVTEALPGAALNFSSYILTFEWKNDSEWVQIDAQLPVTRSIRFSASMSHDGQTLATNYEDQTRRGVVDTFTYNYPPLDQVNNMDTKPKA